MTRTTIFIRKWTMLIHRWMGIAFCLLFIAWFISGIVMMYYPYPRVSAEDRLERTKALDGERIAVSPAEAYRAVTAPDNVMQMSLAMVDDRPVYHFLIGRDRKTVYADSGELLQAAPQDVARRVASLWVGKPGEAASVEGPIVEPDQWTVPQGTMAYKPFWKFTWPSGDQVYVSLKTGQVVQYTTTQARWGAWFGAVPHWIYFTPLRANPVLWNQTVVWLSGAGTVMTLLGLVAGLWLYSPSKRYRTVEGRTSVPFKGQKRWHVILGLLFGLVTCTWIFSGMMSMSPFPGLRDKGRIPDVEAVLRGGKLNALAFQAKLPQQALSECEGLAVAQIDFTTIDGVATYLAYAPGNVSRIVPVSGPALAELPLAEISRIVQRAAQPHSVVELQQIHEYETYYVDRKNRRPLPVYRVRLNDPAEALYYIDAKTARVVQSYGPGSRWNRWLYHGLHSFDLPLLYKYRPAWDIVVLGLMLGGTWLCVTSLVIAWQRLRQKSARWRKQSRKRLLNPSASSASAGTVVLPRSPAISDGD